MLKYLSLSCALHTLVLGYLTYRLGAAGGLEYWQDPAPPPGPNAEFRFSDEGPAMTEDFEAHAVPSGEPAIEVCKRDTLALDERGRVGRALRAPPGVSMHLVGFADHRCASVPVDPPYKESQPLSSVACNVSAVHRAAGTSPLPAIDTAKLLEAAIHRPRADRIMLLQQGVAIAEQIPQEHVKEITAKLRGDYGVQEHAYQPRREAQDARQVDVDHSVVYYRLTSKKGQAYFQELLLDKNGLYIVVSEKPQADMDVADQAKLQVFSNPMLDSIRDIALGFVEQHAEEPKAKKR